MSSFESRFFDFQLPTPLTSRYSEESVRSNDLRLLVEIATCSYLRMSTDPRTNILHFTCKNKGPRCYDLEAYPSEAGYYFLTEPNSIEHEDGCEMKKELGKFLEIYNLMKLKKELIEELMRKLELMEQSPSVILATLSQDKEQYFFEKYLNQNVELRRKLRKRFDNIVNIDIKKIGKPEEKRSEPTVKESRKTKSQTQAQVSRKMQKKKGEKSFKKSQQAQLIFMEQSSVEQPAKHQPSSSNVREPFQPEQMQHSSSGEESSNDNYTPRCKKTTAIKKAAKKDPRPKMDSRRFSNRQADGGDNRESILLLSDSNQKPSEFYFQQVKQDLPEIKALDEYAQMAWSSESSSLSEAEPAEPAPIYEDYFKSLRNSALQRSLEKQSLATVFTSMIVGEANKENQA